MFAPLCTLSCLNNTLSYSFFCALGVDQLSWVDVSRHPTTSYQSL